LEQRVGLAQNELARPRPAHEFRENRVEGNLDIVRMAVLAGLNFILGAGESRPH